MSNSFLDFSGLQHLWGKIKDLFNDSVLTTEKGAANGVASLDKNSKVPTTQLPIIPVSLGGTGTTTANAALHALINPATTLSSSGLASGDFLGVDDISAGTGKKISIIDLLSYLSSHSGGAQIQVGSYRGTGLYGSNSPNHITCDFVLKTVWFYSYKVSSGSETRDTFGGTFRYNAACVVPMADLTTSYSGLKPPYFGSGDPSMESSFSKKSSDGKTLTWYNTSHSAYQFNNSGSTYYWIAFG